jgi:hypothetical protein
MVKQVHARTPIEFYHFKGNLRRAHINKTWNMESMGKNAANMFMLRTNATKLLRRDEFQFSDIFRGRLQPTCRCSRLARQLEVAAQG